MKSRLVSRISTGIIPMLGIGASLLATPSMALQVTKATLKNGTFLIAGKKAQPFATLRWEGQVVATAKKNGAFKFTSTTVPSQLPTSCLASGQLSDGSTQVDVLISLCPGGSGGGGGSGSIPCLRQEGTEAIFEGCNVQIRNGTGLTSEINGLGNLIIGYTTFFRNRETAFLLALPVSWQTIFRWKLLESTLLASWAFVFLIAPLLLAFGLNRHVAWHFYLATPVLLALFLALPGAAGAWLAILLARHLDRRTFQIGLLAAATLLLLAAAFWWKAQPAPDELLETRTLEVLDRLLVKTHFALFPFLPSYWLSTSVLQWAEGALAAAVFFALVLLSHVLFFGLLTLTRLGGLFYDTSSPVQSRASVLDAWTGLRSRRQRHGTAARPCA